MSNHLIWKPLLKLRCHGCGDEVEVEQAPGPFPPRVPDCKNGCYYVHSVRSIVDNLYVHSQARVERPAQNLKDFVEQQKKIPQR